jgi:protein fantom
MAYICVLSIFWVFTVNNFYCQDELPSPYAVYKFYDFADHDTDIVQHSGSPEFNDSHAYPILMNSEIDRYIKSQPLTVYLFDDDDNEQSAYLGSASIPLLPLAHNKEITGTFELVEGGNGIQNGAVEVHLYWQRDYRTMDVTEPVETESKDTVNFWQKEPLAVDVEAFPASPGKVKVYSLLLLTVSYIQLGKEFTMANLNNALSN